MRGKTITVLIGLLVLESQAMSAQPQQDPLQKALDKCAKQHAAIRDMTVIQEITLPSPEGTITAQQISYEKGDKSRMEMTMQPPPGEDSASVPVDLRRVTTVSDGATTWLISPMTGKQQVPDKNDPSTANCWGLKFENARVAGSETVDGHECWIVETGRPDSITDRYWLDKAKLDVLKGESKDREGHVLRWELSDFQPVLGSFEYPHKMEVFNGDTLVASVTVKNITLNTGLADSLFDPDRVEVNKTDMEEMLRRLMQQQGEDTTMVVPDSVGPRFK